MKNTIENNGTNNGTNNGASVRVLAEVLKGETLNGTLETTIKRHTLKGESKCAMIKRLLMTEGETRETIIAKVEREHGTLKDSTLNTIRADLKRTLGALVVAKGWRTDEKHGKLATAAVAKLRAHELGKGYASAELVTVATLASATQAEGEQASAEGEQGATEGATEGEQASATESAEGETQASAEGATEGKAEGKRGKRGKRKASK